MLKKVCVLILNYKEYKLTIDCVESIPKKNGVDCSIVVVDNASPNESVDRLINLIKIDKLISLKINGGYTYGNNVGLEYCFSNGAEYVFVINNDTVVDRDCIKFLVEKLDQNSTIGIIGPKVLYMSAPNKINFAGMIGDLSKATYVRIGLNEIDNISYENLIETLYQDGCALMITKQCYNKIGGFDNYLWTYWEESDLCLRASRAGFKVCCYQKAKIWHQVSATLGSYSERSPASEYYGIRNSIIFHKRFNQNKISKYHAVFRILWGLPRRVFSIVYNKKKNSMGNIFALIEGALVGLISPCNKPKDWFAPIKPFRG